MRYGATRAIVLCGAVLFTAVALQGHIKRRPFPSTTAAEQATASAIANGQSNLLLKQATDDLASLLIQSSDTNPAADEMFAWFTKCDVGLEPCTSSKANTLLNGDYCAKLSTNRTAGEKVASAHVSQLAAQLEWIPNQAVMNAAGAAFEPAKQEISDAAHNLKTDSTVPRQMFNSVLYDPSAACAIRQLGNGQAPVYAYLVHAAQTGKEPTLNFPDGATVVKLIWEIAPKIYAGQTTTQIPAVETGNLTIANGYSNLLPGLPLKDSGTLPLISDWEPNNFVANIPMLNANTPPCTDLPATMNYSPSCFTWITIPQEIAVRITQWAEQGKVVIPPHASREDLGYLVLAGINVMKFQSKSQQWLFSAFWWAKQRPQPALFGPSQWVHFSGCAVMQVRNIGDAVTVNNVCQNPYLEGLESPNGAYSNCANCHNAASFQASTAPADTGSQGGLPQHTNYLNCKSLLDLKGSTPACTDTPDGTGPTAATHQLWSLADIPAPAAPTNPPSK